MAARIMAATELSCTKLHTSQRRVQTGDGVAHAAARGTVSIGTDGTFEADWAATGLGRKRAEEAGESVTVAAELQVVVRRRRLTS